MPVHSSAYQTAPGPYTEMNWAEYSPMGHLLVFRTHKSETLSSQNAILWNVPS